MYIKVNFVTVASANQYCSYVYKDLKDPILAEIGGILFSIDANW